MTIIKDTIREFEEYLDTSKSKFESMMADLSIGADENEVAMIVGDEDESQGQAEDEEEEDDDEEEESVDGYDVSDIGTVENSISLMKVALETLKTGLLVITLVADKNSRFLIPNEASANTSMSPAVSSGSHNLPNDKETTDVMSCDDDGYSCNQWIADVAHYSDVIEGSITDFGADLYPPLNSISCSMLRTGSDCLKNHLNSYVSLLKMKSSYHEDAAVLIGNLLQHEISCSEE